LKKGADLAPFFIAAGLISAPGMEGSPFDPKFTIFQRSIPFINHLLPQRLDCGATDEVSPGRRAFGLTTSRAAALAMSGAVAPAIAKPPINSRREKVCEFTSTSLCLCWFFSPARADSSAANATEQPIWCGNRIHLIGCFAARGLSACSQFPESPCDWGNN
jgi:hypothetical protein